MLQHSTRGKVKDVGASFGSMDSKKIFDGALYENLPEMDKWQNNK